MNSFNLCNNSAKQAGTIIMPILQMEELRHRETLKFTQLVCGRFKISAGAVQVESTLLSSTLTSLSTQTTCVAGLFLSPLLSLVPSLQAMTFPSIPTHLSIPALFLTHSCFPRWTKMATSGGQRDAGKNIMLLDS